MTGWQRSAAWNDGAWAYQDKSGKIRENPWKSEKIIRNQGQKAEGGAALDRSGFIILSVLQEQGAEGRLSAMTVREAAEAEDMGLKENTVYKKLREFERLGYVGRGLKEGTADTYYITAEGCGCLERERSMS